jgi:hypothetical protein
MTTTTERPSIGARALSTIRNMPRRPFPTTTLGELAYLNLRDQMGAMRAALQAARIGSCLLAMAQTADKLGHWPTRAEYAAEWRVTERQVTRDWSAVKAGLGVHPTDQQLADWIQARRHEGVTNSKQLEAQPAPSWMLADAA